MSERMPFARLFLSLIRGIEYRTPVKVASFEGVDKRLGSCDIGRNGYIVYVAQTQEIHLIGLMGLGSEGIAEEQQQVYLIA